MIFEEPQFYIKFKKWIKTSHSYPSGPRIALWPKRIGKKIYWLTPVNKRHIIRKYLPSTFFDPGISIYDDYSAIENNSWKNWIKQRPKEILIISLNILVKFFIILTFLFLFIHFLNILAS